MSYSGPVMCNFFDGLANMVQVRTHRSVTRRDSLDVMTAHAYPHRVSRDIEHDADFEHLVPEPTKRRQSPRRRRRDVKVLPADVFNRDYFTPEFFDSLLTDILKSR